MFIYGEFSSSNYTHGATTGDYDKSRQYLEFDLSNHQPIELKIATSFISQTQAQNNLSLEINNDHLNFDSLHNRATNI
jgi:putative alpha-1,2-mannosidase